MTDRKDLIIAVLATFCLVTTLFSIIPVRSAPAREYNPMADLTGPEGVPDGRIDMRDIGYIVNLFGATGTPRNWTLLFECVDDLKAKVNELNTTLLMLEKQIAQTSFIAYAGTDCLVTDISSKVTIALPSGMFTNASKMSIAASALIVGGLDPTTRAIKVSNPVLSVSNATLIVQYWDPIQWLWLDIGIGVSVQVSYTIVQTP